MQAVVKTAGPLHRRLTLTAVLGIVAVTVLLALAPTAAHAWNYARNFCQNSGQPAGVAPGGTCVGWDYYRHTDYVQVVDYSWNYWANRKCANSVDTQGNAIGAWACGNLQTITKNTGHHAGFPAIHNGTGSWLLLRGVTYF